MREVNLKHTEFAELSVEILSKGGALRFKAHGSSMVPFIRNGDILTIQPVEGIALNVGDVAFYHASGGRMVAHRVIGRHKQNSQMVLMMRGDAASGSVETVRVEQVLGKVVGIQRGKKVSRSDRGAQRLGGLLWIRVSPLGLLLLRLARIGRRIVLYFLS